MFMNSLFLVILIYCMSYHYKTTKAYIEEMQICRKIFFHTIRIQAVCKSEESKQFETLTLFSNDICTRTLVEVV